MRKETLGILLLSTALCACHRTTPPQDNGNYKTMVVKQEDCTLEAEYTARLQGCQVVEIRPQISGLITRICINEGQRVYKGQTLFVIDPVPYKAALDEATANVRSAEARLSTARLNWESTKVLREKNVVQDYDLTAARNEFAVAEAALAQARAQATNARNNLSYTEVKSPVDGVAGMIAYRVGALVGSGISEPLVTVSDDSRMYAYFSLTDNQVTELTEKYGSLDKFVGQMQEVNLRMSNGQTYAENGHIAAASGIVSAQTGTVTVRADFPNPKKVLRDGGNGTVIVPTRLERRIVIPQGATYELQNKTFVYKIVNGRTQSVAVGLYRLNDGKKYVVESGLQPGDTIIAEGAGLMKEGVAVNRQEERRKP